MPNPWFFGNPQNLLKVFFMVRLYSDFAGANERTIRGEIISAKMTSSASSGASQCSPTDAVISIVYNSSSWGFTAKTRAAGARKPVPKGRQDSAQGFNAQKRDCVPSRWQPSLAD